MSSSTTEEAPEALYKQEAAERAVEQISSGMIVGLGSGTTALLALRRIAQLLTGGQLHSLLAVPTSRHAMQDASRLGIPLTTLDEHPLLDLTIDGADEVDPSLNLIKGAGGALLREKIVAQASRREIIVVDETKLSPRLGTLATVPVEVIPFGWPTQASYLESLGARATLRRLPSGEPFMTDQLNLILDCTSGPIEHPDELVARLDARAGIVEHGLFLGMTSEVMCAGRKGITVLKR